MRVGKLESESCVRCSGSCREWARTYFGVVFEMELEVVERRAVVDEAGRVEFGELRTQTVPRQLHREY